MSRQDLKSNISVARTLAPASQADPALPVNGTGVDLSGFDSALVVINAGVIAGASASLTFEVQESDDNSSFTAVANSDLDGTEPVIAAANDDQVHLIGYRGTKRYIRVAITAKAGTTPTMPCDATVLRSRGRRKPY
ncbi:hypothetical protein [Nonomuraea sp. NPDC050310]|uniref:hypothetical protein n=1 Tax=Nonomuraea sp. NPDC050310 TaxID=3154935 RepID=UPI00340B03D1